MNKNEAKSFGLSLIDCHKIQTVLSRHQNIKQAIIYGSRAMGTYKPGSDIDMTFIGEISWAEFQQLETELDDLMLPYQFDISLKNHIDNPQLLDHIDDLGKKFYKKECE